MAQQQVDFEQIVALASDGILLLDCRGVIRYANAAAARLFARPVAAVLDEYFGFVVTPDEPIEIEIARAGGRIISADVQRVDMTMAGQPVTLLYLRDVTERKLAEKEIRRREAFYATILRDLPELICRWRPDGTISYVSENYCRYFGKTREELIEKGLLLVIPAEDRERFASELAEHLRRLSESQDEEDAFVVTEQLVSRADGAPRWQRWVSRGLFDATGQLTEVQSTGQDITEAREIALKLREAERIAEAASLLAKIGGWEVDLRAGRVTWSDEVCRLHEEPLGTSVQIEDGIAYYAPEWRERISTAFAACARAGIGYDEELELITARGRRRWVRAIGAAVRDETGQITHVQGAIQDITERRQTEEQLRLAATVFDNTSEGILITDTTPTVIAINRAFTEINGYDADEIVGRNPSLLKSGRHDANFYREMWREILARGHWRGEIWNRRRDGQVYPQWVNINAVRSIAGRTTHYVGVFSDISDIKRSERQIERLAHRDPLTDLPNRLLFRTLMEQALLRAEVARSEVSVLLLDLDGFRHVNDSLGHGVGDQALCKVAGRLAALIRPDETVARLSGDEFALLIEGDDDTDTRACLLAERVIETLARPLSIDGREIFVSASIGIATYPQDGTSVAQLLQNGDAALYLARESGGNGYRHYASALSDYARDRVVLTADLHRAIERDELELYYQPQVDMRAGRVIGLEALVRWRHPERGLLAPSAFIRIAEETGLIIPLGEWVLHHAARQALAWQCARLPFGRIAVNVSGVQVQRSDLAGTVAAVLREVGLPTDCLELEMTETTTMDLSEQAPTLLVDLKRLGVALAMDDFGTGYSSLAYLKDLPFDTIKIDRSFIGGLPDDQAGAAIIGAITALGTNLGFKVLAEGVETQAQRGFLLGVGCDLAQGYLFSPPVPADEVAAVLLGLAGDTA